ncbi:MAG: sigma-70 family RNA polymerase sigma factor [Chitinophagaceae bacterium]
MSTRLNQLKKSEIDYLDFLFPYAYNILGSAEDAKDAVQDVLVKHFANSNEHIDDQKNYLIKSIINLAINMKSRQKKTIHSDELWLPEPVATDDAADKNIYLNEVLSYSLLILMENLNAKERAVFILKESFDYTHLEIADILTITEEHSRQLLSRAKASIFKPGQKRTEKQVAHERNVLERFMTAIRQRDAQQLEDAMADDIRFYADGGGKVPLLATRCVGSADVAALIMKVYYLFLTSAKIEYAVINHQPALLSYKAGRLNSCQVFDLHPKTNKVLQINAVLDPDKLKSLSQKIFS